MTRQTNVLGCKPEELYLALAHIENKLARAWMRKLYGRKQFPLIQLQCCLNIMCSITTMDMRRISFPYSRIRLEPEISRLQGLKAFPTSSIAQNASKDVTGKVSWPAELFMLDQVLTPRKRVIIASLITVPTKPSTRAIIMQ
jgi:hypothetical protein